MTRLPRFCGIDTGERCAIAVRERLRPEGDDLGPARWMYFETPPIESLKIRCAAIFDHLGVEAVVVDGAPHTQLSREVYDLLPAGGFIWRHTPGDMTVRGVPFLGVERRYVFINREELIDRLVEEFRAGGSRLPLPRDTDEEALLGDVDAHLCNLRKALRWTQAGERVAYERNENHFGFACAYAKLAEEVAESEGILAGPAGGFVAPALPAKGPRFWPKEGRRL